MQKTQKSEHLDHTYLLLTRRAFYSPTLRSLLERLPLSVPGSAFPERHTGGFWERSQVPVALNGNALDGWDYNSQNPLGRQPQATSCDHLLPFPFSPSTSPDFSCTLCSV